MLCSWGLVRDCKARYLSFSIATVSLCSLECLARRQLKEWPLFTNFSALRITPPSQGCKHGTIPLNRRTTILLEKLHDSGNNMFSSRPWLIKQHWLRRFLDDLYNYQKRTMIRELLGGLIRNTKKIMTSCRAQLLISWYYLCNFFKFVPYRSSDIWLSHHHLRIYCRFY